MDDLKRFLGDLNDEGYADVDHDWKTSLINNLYSRVEDLRAELNTKNNQINKLLDTQNILMDKLIESKTSILEAQNQLMTQLRNTKLSVSTHTSENENKINLDNSIVSGADHNDCFSSDHSLSFISTNPSQTQENTDKAEQINVKHNQLEEIRTMKHDEFKLLTNNEKNKTLMPNKNTWPKNTVLVVTDSMFNNIEENRLSKSYNVKVRAFSGATVNDMFSYITPCWHK